MRVGRINPVAPRDLAISRAIEFTHPTGLALVARHQVPVAVERNGDRRAPHIGGERLGVHARGDHEGSVGVAALMEADRLQLVFLPCLARPPHERLRREGMLCPSPKHKRLFAGAAQEAMGGDLGAQGLAKRHPPPSRAALRSDRPHALIPASLDPDHPLREVDVGPAKRLELAAAKTGVKRARPKRTVAFGKRADQGLGLGRPCNQLAPSSCRGEAKPERRVWSTSEREIARR
jgi:hypothetical protein